MANVRENLKNGKIASFRFVACADRDAEGKQRLLRTATIQEISAIDIQRYLLEMRSYKNKYGKGLSSKSLRHQYVALCQIFNDADKHELLIV